MERQKIIIYGHTFAGEYNVPVLLNEMSVDDFLEKFGKPRTTKQWNTLNEIKGMKWCPDCDYFFCRIDENERSFTYED